MFRVLSCISNDHNLSLLSLSIVVCVAGSWTGINTYVRARQEPRAQLRLTWIGLATLSVASAVWATHFAAMLAYRPDLPIGWNVEISGASLILAVACTGLGLWIGTSRTLWLAPETGGAIIGLGIAGMHYLGMRAFEVAGRIEWDPSAVFWSLVIGVVFGTLSLSRAARPFGRFCKYGAMGALVIAIAGLHFTGMSAVTIVPDPTVRMDPNAIANEAFGYVTAAIAMLVIGSGLITYRIDRRSTVTSMARMHRLANATTEAIVIARHGTIIDANERFVALAGKRLDDLVSRPVSDFWADMASPSTTGALDFDGELRSSTDVRIPVHIVASLGADGERIYALRDLRSKLADEARIQHMVHYDALTGLGNRATFVAAVEAAIERNEPVAVLYIDLDRFKEANDTHGHLAGDAVLIETAQRLTTVMAGDLCARLGGDEFAVLMRLDETGTAKAEQLALALAVPVMRDGATIRTGASIGVAQFPADAQDSIALIGNADIAMYAAKAERKSGVCRFDVGMGEAVRRRRTLSQDLATAVVNEELEVHYQVQTSLQTGRTIGFEALVRWNHPAFGLVSPGEFIGLAEANGTIAGIGAWVMHRACLDAARWPDRLTVAVNLSPAQFAGDVEGMIRSALAQSGLAADRLEVEITESLLINDLERALKVLQAIKALGASIAMDDFGTGYSSLSTLQAFPFDKIKIDRSFVDKLESSPQAAAIVRAVVNLGHSLAIPVLAEGVEQEAHLEILRALGCESAQGYLIGRPTPLAGIRRHLPPQAMPEAA